ncbi:hypothetical protein KP509_35G010900 [Ceratopteris richardii]|uniref:Uncharacterized protein n=1 Tax=Ceratopteris richardii TaxID=49495 RepID=A0A8T2QDE1_CERRI|nr:hypothetical protein KP509_35G010900 [Ceratopteris richardii]
MEHIFFTNDPPCTIVSKLRDNCIDFKGQINCSQTFEAWHSFMQGDSSMTNYSSDTRCSTPSLSKGHKFQNQGNSISQGEVLALTTASEDHSSFNNPTGVSCSQSISSERSSMYFDESTDELQLPEYHEEGHPTKGVQFGQSYAPTVEDLQLDLLECALEYELKILEMKMKMVQMRPNHGDSVQMQSSHQDTIQNLKIDQGIQEAGPQQPELPAVSGRLEKLLAEKLHACRKKMSKLQNQKDALAKELMDFRKKQRKFELQRRNMDEMLRRVNNLQRILSKKEEEMMECQLKEKEAKVRLHEFQIVFQKSRAKTHGPEHMMKLIPSLQTWLRSLKRDMQKLTSGTQSPSSIQSVASGCNTPVDCIKEVYELQKELERLANLR